MGRLLDDLASGARLVVPPLGRWRLVEPVAGHQVRRVVAKQPPGLVDRVEIAPVVADGGDESGAAHGFVDLAGEGGIEGDRLLDEERDPGRDGSALRGAVGKGRHADPQGVEIEVGEHLLVRGERPGTRALGGRDGARGIGIGDARDGDVLEALENAEVPVGNAPGPDEADLEHGWRSPADGRRAQHRAVEGRGLGRHALGGEGLFVASPPGLADGTGSSERGCEGIGEALHVAGLGEEEMVGPERLDHTLDAGRDHRQAHGHRLEHHEGEPFEARGEGEKVGGGHQVADVLTLAEEGDGVAAMRFCLAGAALGTFADKQETGVQTAGMEHAHGPDEGALVLLGGETADAEEERRVLRDAERRAGLGAGAVDARRLDAVADHGKSRADAEAGARGHPGRGRRLGDGDEGIDGRGGGGVVRLLRGIGDEPRQVLGPHDRHARGGAGGRKGVALPADPGVHVQEAGAHGVEEGGLRR